MLAIDIQESRATVEQWVKQSGVSFTVLLDGDGAVTRQYGVTVTPTVFILGRDGKLHGKALGTKDWRSPAGRALLEALLRS